MDSGKFKEDTEEKGAGKGQEELEKLKARLGGFNSGELSTTNIHQKKRTESQASPPGHDSGEPEPPGRTRSTPVMDSGKADIGEPDTPSDKEKIREPEPEPEHKPDEEHVQQAAVEQRRESRREAATEQNPPNDVEDQSEDAA